MSNLSNAGLDLAWLQIVKKQVENLDYGVVQIVVHERQVVQIDRTERTRLKSQSPPDGKVKGGA